MADKCKLFIIATYTSQGLVFYRDTCVYIFKSYWHKYGNRNMSAKQGIHKLS